MEKEKIIKPVLDKTLTRQEKLRQFWNHSLNPITGFYVNQNDLNRGTGIIESVPDFERYRKNNRNSY